MTKRVIEQDSDQKHDTDNQERQVSVDLCETNSLGNNGKGEHPEDNAHYSTKTTREENATRPRR